MLSIHATLCHGYFNVVDEVTSTSIFVVDGVTSPLIQYIWMRLRVRLIRCVPRARNLVHYSQL